MKRQSGNDDSKLNRITELWTYAELVSFLKIPKSTVYMYVAMEKIPCIRIGRHVRFIPEEVERAIRKLPA